LVDELLANFGDMQGQKLKVLSVLKTIDANLQAQKVKSALSKMIIFCGMKMHGVTGGGSIYAYID
jgi:hypothetical protein